MELIDSLEDIKRLAADWDKLPGPSSNPLLSSDWFGACAQATSSDAKVVIAFIRGDKGIRAIAPLAVNRRYGVPTLEFLSNPVCRLFEPSDLIYADEGSLFALLDGLKALGKPLFLSRVSTKSLTVSVLTDARNRLPSIPLRSGSRSFFVPISGSWDDFEAKISASRRARMRRRAKTAKKMGAVAFSITKPNPSTYLGHLETFMEIEKSGWKGKKGTALAQHHQQRYFFERYFEAVSKKGQLVVFSMTIDDKPIAMRFAVAHGQRLWELKIAYDEAFGRCAPGMLLTHETIRYAFEQGFDAYEFLGEDEEWERLWTDSTHDYRSFGLYPLTASGLLGLGMFAANYAKARTGHILSTLRRPAESNSAA